jgi:peptidoglycan hydrolase CwlO-like protein
MYLAGYRLTVYSKSYIIVVMDSILDRINQAEKSISTVKSKVAYKDLRKMLAGVDKVVTQLSQESVECRRIKRDTSKYQDLIVEANQLLDNLEQHITFASLIG